MTDAEITRLLAEKVMGWTLVKYEYFSRVYIGDCVTGWTLDDDDDMNAWQPLNCIAHAWMVVEALGKQGWRCRMDHPFTDWEECTAGFTNSRRAAQEGRFEFRAQAAEMPRAICLAAVKAIEGAK